MRQISQTVFLALTDCWCLLTCPGPNPTSETAPGLGQLAFNCIKAAGLEKSLLCNPSSSSGLFKMTLKETTLKQKGSVKAIAREGSARGLPVHLGLPPLSVCIET